MDHELCKSVDSDIPIGLRVCRSQQQRFHQKAVGVIWDRIVPLAALGVVPESPKQAVDLWVLCNVHSP